MSGIIPRDLACPQGADGGFDLTEDMAEDAGDAVTTNRLLRTLATQKGTVVDALDRGYPVQSLIGKDLSPGILEAQARQAIAQELSKDDCVGQIAVGSLSAMTTSDLQNVNVSFRWVAPAQAPDSTKSINDLTLDDLFPAYNE